LARQGLAEPHRGEARAQQPPVWRAELPLTLPVAPAVADGPAAIVVPDPLIAPELPPVWLAELPLTPVPPVTTVPEPLAAPVVPVVPGCSMQFGLTKPEAPVFGPPCARAIELEPTIKAATLNNLNDVFM
jgi:hypothetical protein